MTYYMIKEENELRIIPVPTGQEKAFQAKYAQRILVSGHSLREVLVAFDELPLVISPE